LRIENKVNKLLFNRLNNKVCHWTDSNENTSFKHVKVKYTDRTYIK